MAQVMIEDDKKLWDLWLKQKDREACDDLVRLYLPLVHYHVQRIASGLPKNVNRDELYSHGHYGLFDAIEKFNPERDLKFDTYASFRVRGAIIDGLRKADWLPRSMREKVKKVDAVVEKLEQLLGRNVTVLEIAHELGMTEAEVTQIQMEQFTANMLSIDEYTQEQDKSDTFMATIVDEKTLTPEQKLMDDLTKKELVEHIRSLNEKEQLVISLFYYEGLTLTEIGEVLNLSTSRISQIHSKSIARLKQAFSKKIK
ncbi:FliA/WhiG family RNA polymerase sigma factor [Alkalihalobacillus pseudalcaliphilus]|uniref:FliA/WhiG family RNA polymerase sigma factor n=1 Tax=Alkalihalobacillus pseudalcaliphilus TaxID=79884 RepID=UPI00064DF040|nr:FliA/WhiG family RNA polymerase sigma factor [Alkalihalobacillus pseudalcaliphilus]KMK77236.1 RNA polymerase sigma factor SigD [Alkalihalobacillus pseudalcaliphilus]